MFTVSKTYEVVTPESANDGEVAESGFAFEDSPMTLRAVLREVRWLGGYSVSRGAAKVYLYAHDDDIDYRTGARTGYALHIAAAPRNIARLARFI